ncbi:poly(A) polymerase [Streptomyces sp. NPDC002033]|uniref:poly(A) polymerase n=1 Tax=unclassified Streptomyces TaxID=2593676 RepID=UPI0033255804
MRTSEQLYHQVRWDPRFDAARFTLGLLQRGAGPARVPLPSFVPGGDIPWHRVLFVEADGELVWDRASGVDLIDTTRAGRVRETRLLAPPFFSARTPHAWDPSDGGGWRPDRAGPGAAPPEVVRMLTWNTLWDRYDAPLIATARRRPLLLAALAAADADVIALQEVEPALLAMLLAAPWVRAGYTLGTDPAGPDVAGHGLVILSRLPVREAGVHALRAHKAVTAVTVDTAGGSLVVAATHLTSDHTADGGARREAELALIGEGLGGVEAEVALLGDFNDGRSGAEGPAAVLGMRDAWNEVHGPADDSPTFDPGVNPLAAVGSLSGRAARLDRILVRPSGGARVRRAALLGERPDAQGLFASDHFGVEASVGYGARAGGDARGADGPARLGVPATARTAVAWLPPEDPAVGELRRAYDPRADRWPAHVNLLFGFVPESDFERALPLLAEGAAGVAPFTARLEGVHSFGQREEATLWLDPAAGEGGEAPWRRLRQALADRFPGCRGRAGDWTPHLTLGRSADPQRDLRACAARLGGGRRVPVGSLAVLSRRGDGPMRVRATVALGTGEIRWTPPEAPSATPPGAASEAPPEGSATPSEAGAAALAARVEARIAAALPGALVRVAGSRRMGCALPDSDLDLVAVLPGAPDGGAVRARLAAALPGAERLREVTGARVPGVRLRTSGLDVDLVLVGAAARAEPDEATAVALSALGDADAVRAAVGADHAAFARLAREVKAWARARGLDCAPFGGLPGLAWAVLAARTVREAGDRSPRALLREFFGTWAAWDWTRPVALDARLAAVTGSAVLPGPASPSPSPAAPDPVTVLTPSAPVRSCTGQVGEGMRDLLVLELYRAWEALEADPEGFGRLVSAPPLHRRHAAWAVVDVRAHAPREFEERLGRARGRLRALLGALADAGCRDAHAWPRPFERSVTTARYAIGLGPTPPDAAALAVLAGPWSAGLPGVTVSWTPGGEVPDLP